MDTLSPFHPNAHKHPAVFHSLHPASAMLLDSTQHCRQKPDHYSAFFSIDSDLATRRLERVEREGVRKGVDVPTGRCRSPLVPLRNRQLPASFWEEPNVPRVYPYPFFPYPVMGSMHPMSTLWNEYSSGAGAVAGASIPQTNTTRTVPGKTCSTPVQSSKDFLERLQSAQARGYDLASSRFPITEFLFYNYGIKSYLDSSAAGNTELLHRECPLPGSAAHWLSSSIQRSESREAASVSSAAAVGAAKVASVGGMSGFAGGGCGLTFPTLCPYLGYNCPNLHSGQTPHRFWDCVMGQRGSLTSSSGLSAAGMQCVGHAWKSNGGRTVSAYPTRFHPFANG